MEIAICAATPLELAPLQSMAASLQAAEHQLRYCITGIGMLQSCFFIQRHIHKYHPDFLLQIGIAGCLDRTMPLGSVALVEKEYLGSLGVMENSSSINGWQDVFDLGLQNADNPPFHRKALENPFVRQCLWVQQSHSKTVSAVTVDEITTDPLKTQMLKELYQPALESMEGAALHFNGLMHQIPFLQIRGISNYIGERDKSKWQIGQALRAVTEKAVQFLQFLQA